MCEVFGIPSLLAEDLVSHRSIAITLKRVLGQYRFKIFLIKQ